jgi:putative acetyltransferase
MQIERDDLTRPQVHALLEEHLADMRAWSPPESVHALDLSRLRSPDISFWTAWDGDRLLACGALKQLSPTHGEIKSMRTPTALRRRGAARAMLAHILAEASARGYERLSLETGSQDGFAPARQLYAAAGFEVCGPFGGYRPDPNSVFMTLELARAPAPAELPPLPATPVGRYRHYKGRFYEVVGAARHSETHEALVVYRPLYGTRELWVRPHAMFFGSVEADGRMQPRFAPAPD